MFYTFFVLRDLRLFFFEIINKLDNVKNKDLRNKIKEIAIKYPHWYYYLDNTVITDKRIYI